MPIIIRTAASKEMKKNIKIVQAMTRGMRFDENMGKVNWKRVRKISNFGYQFMPREKGVTIYRIKVGNTVSEMTIPKNPVEDVVILYLHGGGFVSGSASASRGYASMLAKYSGYRVVAVNYRLAPEYPYPRGLDDCFRVYQSVSKRYPQSKIVLCGESAGANLAIAVALKARDHGYVNISSLIVHSPFMDFTDSLDRTKHEIKDITVQRGCLKALEELYVGAYDMLDPYISPLYASYEDFPPVFITCDYNETLYADAKALYDHLIQNEIDVTMILMRHSFHAFAAIGTGTPETTRILKENVEFIRKHLTN